MSLLAYTWQTIMRKTHFGGTFFRFFTFGTAIHKRDIALFPSERSDQNV